MKTETILEQALKCSQHFPVFPLSSYSSIPLKGTHGFKDATINQDEIRQWFSNQGKQPNYGICLQESDVFVIDIDRKNGVDGLQTLKELMGSNNLEAPTVVETPNGGYHLYYRTKIKIKQQINWKPGIDVLKNSITGPGSRKMIEKDKIANYKMIQGTLGSIEEAPSWLMDKLLETVNPSKNVHCSNSDEQVNPIIQVGKRKKKYTAVLLETLLDGCIEGNRNNWIAKYIGTFLALGMDAEKTLRLIYLFNDNVVNPSLSEDEVNRIYLSILKAELKNNNYGG